MLTILPCPRSTMGRPSCWVRKNSPDRLTSSTAFHESSVTSTASWRSMMPALFTRMSTSCSARDLRADGGDRGVVAEVELDDRHLATEVADRPSPCRVWLSGRPTSTRSAPASREAERDALAEPATGTGHDGTLAGQVEGRAGHSSSSATGARSVYCVFSPDIAQMKA